ncbi:MAG TPA: HAD-IA family hydrolase [Blastocatellia bacterium]|nr:HAD-IA family hydrolase [Blastocatellia bacterium]
MKNDLSAVKAIFFDAGGTLIHLDSARIAGLVAEELGIELALDGFSLAQGRAMTRVAEMVAAGLGTTENLKRQFYSMLLPEIGIPETSLASAVESVLRLAREEMLWRIAGESAASVLERLKERGYLLAVVSNSDGRIERAFKQAALDRYFDFFIDSFIVGVEKPDPAIFRFALERARISPHEAAYIGDLYHNDMVCARKAGLLPILFDPFELNPSADCLRIRNLDDLLLHF